MICSFETASTANKRLKKLSTFNNATVNNRTIQKTLASWMFRILSAFDFQKIDGAQALEALSHCIYGYIKYCWVLVKQFSSSDIASNHKSKKFLTSWIFRKSFSLVGACIIDGFDMNWFTNLKQVWTYLHLSKQCMFVSLKLD